MDIEIKQKNGNKAMKESIQNAGREDLTMVRLAMVTIYNQ